MNKLKILFILSVIFFAGNSVYATSGACSSHRGAMCSVGPDSDGSVVCNDGWRDSTVSFYDTDECNSVDSCPFYIRGEDTYNKFKKQWDDTISEIKNRNQNDCEDSFQRYQTITNQSYDSCVSSRRNMVQWGGTFAFNGNNDCEKERDKEIQSNETRKASCLHNSDDAIFKYQRLSSCMRLDTSDYCPSLYGNNSHYNSDKGCICNDGFFFNNNKCTPEKEAQEAVCQDAHGQNAHWDNPIKACTCNTGYVIDKNKNELCVPIDNWCIENNGPNYYGKDNKCVQIEEIKKITPIVENIIKPVESKPIITKPKIVKPEVKIISKEPNKEEIKKTETLTQSTQTQESIKVKPVQKPSIFKRFSNWFVNLF